MFRNFALLAAIFSRGASPAVTPEIEILTRDASTILTRSGDTIMARAA